MSKKSNFSFIPIIIIALAIGLSKCDRIMYSLNKKNKSKFEFQLCMKETNDAFKCTNPLKKKDMPVWFKDMIEKLKKEDKIKDKNYEPIKPVNPHK